MNSVTAHRPLRDTAEAVSLRYRCSVPPSPATTHSILIWRGFSLFEFGMVVAGEVGFLLREKLTEFKTDSVWPNYFLGKGIWQTLGGFPARRKGSGE